jgi:DNA-binding NarL/FixJ family response regulator
MDKKLRIVLADDHETVREGLRMIVNSQDDMEVVGEANNGRAAVQIAQELNPDVVVMDVSMPELNGLKATAKLKKLCPDIKIVALTRHTDDGYLKELLRNGASGYVLKQSVSGELLNAVRAVVEGKNYLDPSITSSIIGNFVRKSNKEFPITSETVSERESEVLRQIAWGYSNKEIAHSLELSVKTIEAHKANAMRKLQMRSRIDIVRYAILQGWLHEN